MLQRTNDRNDQAQRVATIEMVIGLPDDFPPKYHLAVIRAAGMCTVKRPMDSPPDFMITTRNGRLG